MEEEKKGVPQVNGDTDAKTNQIDKRHSTHVPAHIKIVRDLQSCVVRGFTFSFLHRLEGKWSGEVQHLYNKATGTPGSVNMSSRPGSDRAVSTKVTYDADCGHWILRETSAAPDGAANVQYLKMTPVGSGVLSVQIVSETYQSSSSLDPGSAGITSSSLLTLTEIPNGAELVQRQSGTGHISLFELILIADDGQLIRTSNSFDKGDLEAFTVTRQRRVR